MTFITRFLAYATNLPTWLLFLNLSLFGALALGFIVCLPAHPFDRTLFYKTHIDFIPDLDFRVVPVGNGPAS
jgi:hypothetical protein